MLASHLPILCSVSFLDLPGSCAPILAELAARSEETPGLSWRVGVGLGQVVDVDAVLQGEAIEELPTLKPTKTVAAVSRVTALAQQS